MKFEHSKPKLLVCKRHEPRTEGATWNTHDTHARHKKMLCTSTNIMPGSAPWDKSFLKRYNNKSESPQRSIYQLYTGYIVIYTYYTVVFTLCFYLCHCAVLFSGLVGVNMSKLEGTGEASIHGPFHMYLIPGAVGTSWGC